MTFPGLILGILISSIFGTLLHLIRGGGAGHMLLYLTMAWIGFWGGHALGVRWELEFFSMGPLHLGTALLGCFIGLGFGYWLGLVEISDIE